MLASARGHRPPTVGSRAATRPRREPRTHLGGTGFGGAAPARTAARSAGPEICCVVAMRAMSTRSLIRLLPVTVSPLTWVPRIAANVSAT
jgi:hypothetical protein